MTYYSRNGGLVVLTGAGCDRSPAVRCPLPRILFLVLRICSVECQQGALDSTPLHHVLPQLHRVLGAWPCAILEDIPGEIPHWINPPHLQHQPCLEGHTQLLECPTPGSTVVQLGRKISCPHGDVSTQTMCCESRVCNAGRRLAGRKRDVQVVRMVVQMLTFSTQEVVQVRSSERSFNCVFCTLHDQNTVQLVGRLTSALCILVYRLFPPAYRPVRSAATLFNLLYQALEAHPIQFLSHGEASELTAPLDCQLMQRLSSKLDRIRISSPPQR